MTMLFFCRVPGGRLTKAVHDVYGYVGGHQFFDYDSVSFDLAGLPCWIDPIVPDSLFPIWRPLVFHPSRLRIPS